MPQLKQPASLESIVLQSIENLVLDLGHQLLDKVCTGVQATALPIKWGVPSYIQQSTRKKVFKFPDIEKLQLFLHPDLPLHLSDAVTKVVLKAITTLISRAKCTNDGFSKSGDDSCRAILDGLTASSLHGRISLVDLLEWPWLIGEVLLSHLYKFHHLKILKLWPGSWSPVWTTVVTTLEHDCCTMSHLVSFSMRCHCTDKILEVLAKSSKLQYLDVMSSVEVTDACVKSVLKFTKLKIVNMASTSLTADGYVQLLVGLPQISRFVWFDLHSRALASVNTPNLSLHSYEASRVTADQLNTIVRKCPYLMQISLHWLQADLSMLTTLKHLRELKVSNCCAVASNLKGLLEVTGYNLLSLELHEVISVDLVMVGIFCPNLKRMTLVCEYQSTGQYIPDLNVPMFRNLEELMCGSEYSDCLFSNCVNIKKLELSKCRSFNDRMVATLLMKNPLKKLEMLTIVHCGLLSLSTAHLLLTSCDNLKVLEGLDSWGGINKLQYAELSTEMRSKNMDIEILWKKPLQIHWE